MMNRDKLIFIYSMKENIFLLDLYMKLIHKHGNKIDTFILINPRITNSFEKILNELYYRVSFWGVISTIKFLIINFWYKIRSLTLKKKCNLDKIRLIKFDKHSDALNYIEKLSPEIVLTSIDYLIPEKFLLNKTLFLNSHCSVLPKYKGYDSVFWALYNNEKYYGATIHKISNIYDNGEIVDQISIQKNSKSTYYSIVRESYNLIYIMYDRLFQNDFNYKGVPNKKSKIYNKPHSSLGKKFRKNGGKFF